MNSSYDLAKTKFSTEPNAANVMPLIDSLVKGSGLACPNLVLLVVLGYTTLD